MLAHKNLVAALLRCVLRGSACPVKRGACLSGVVKKYTDYTYGTVMTKIVTVTKNKKGVRNEAH